MESIINKNENNNSENLSNENIKKICPFCKNIITLKEYEEHILSHEFNQFENRNNINDCGINKNNENNFQIPYFFNYLKTTVNELINTKNNNTNNINIINNRNNNNSNSNISNNNNNNNIRNNNNNNISNNNNNIRNNNIYNNNNNNSNINRNNINNINNNNNIIINSDDDNDYNSDSESNIDKITDKMKPAISKVTDFFKGLFKKNGDSDDSNSSGDEPIINLRIPSLPSLRFISGRRRRSNSLNDLHININNNNNNNNNNYNNNNNNNNNNNDIDDILLDDLLNDEYIKNLSKDDYKEILRYIPTSTVKEVKKNSENNKCIICLSEFQVGEKESTLPCLHIFHSNCIEKWITEKRWCPICKYDISLKSLLSENNI